MKMTWDLETELTEHREALVKIQKLMVDVGWILFHAPRTNQAVKKMSPLVIEVHETLKTILEGDEDYEGYGE